MITQAYLNVVHLILSMWPMRDLFLQPILVVSLFSEKKFPLLNPMSKSNRKKVNASRNFAFNLRISRTIQSIDSKNVTFV
jgi:hypothetical protein